MARRPSSSWGDIISAGSNLYQNKQLAQQTAQNEAMLLQMEQQAMMQRMQEMKRQNIIEARKTVIKLGKLSEQAIVVSETNPEYALMMIGRILELVRSSGLNADFFEEIGDMERATEMNDSLEAAESSIRSSMIEEQISDSENMQRFIDIEEDEMEAHIAYCRANEDWSKNSAEFAEVDPLHLARKKKFQIYFGASLVIGAIIAGAGIGMMGECLEYDADDVCQTYENESALATGILALGGLIFLLGFLGGLPGYFWSRKYQSQWQPLRNQLDHVESIEGRFQSMTQKYGTTSSVEISERRSSMIAWTEKLSPTDPSMILDLD